MFVVLYVFCFLFWSGHVAGVPGRFLLDLDPGVDVVGKESRFSLFGWKVPDFVDAFDLVPLFDGFDEFWGAPGSS